VKSNVVEQPPPDRTQQSPNQLQADASASASPSTHGFGLQVMYREIMVAPLSRQKAPLDDSSILMDQVESSQQSQSIRDVFNLVDFVPCIGEQRDEAQKDFSTEKNNVESRKHEEINDGSQDDHAVNIEEPSVALNSENAVTSNSSNCQKQKAQQQPPVSNRSFCALERGDPIWALWTLDGFLYPGTLCEAMDSDQTLVVTVRFHDGSKGHISSKDILSLNVVKMTTPTWAKPDAKIIAALEFITKSQCCSEAKTKQKRKSKSRRDRRWDEEYFRVVIHRVYAPGTYLVECTEETQENGSVCPLFGMIWVAQWDEMRLGGDILK
jgi:hypothetical protein